MDPKLLSGRLRDNVLGHFLDAALFLGEPDQWPVSLQMFEEDAGMMGIHTSCAKTKFQNRTGLGPRPASITVEGKSVETTQKFRHLACDIHSSGYSSPDIFQQLGLALIYLRPTRPCLEQHMLQTRNQVEDSYNLCPPRPTLQVRNMDIQS